MFTNFVQRRRIYYLISAVVITLGIIAMIYSTIRYGSPVRLSIDFRGGSLFVVEFEDEASETAIREVYTDFGLDDPIIQQLGDPSENRWQIRAGTLAPDQQAALISALEERVAPMAEDHATLAVNQASLGRAVASAGV